MFNHTSEGYSQYLIKDLREFMTIGEDFQPSGYRDERRVGYKQKVQGSPYRDSSYLGYSPHGRNEIPIVTNIQVHETRPTSNYNKLKSLNTRLITYADAWPSIPRRKHACQELRGGVLHVRCSCCYRDGLQDDCPIRECRDPPICVVYPVPRYEPPIDHKHRGEDLYYD